ncbi:MAG: hypothetical protein GXY13_11755 [Acidimicrobiales bacterium]|nr:hypothetical protein [Acidimicrobiales bacterium]
MACYDVTLKDRTVESVRGADAYQQEGPMTTFFRTDGTTRIDSWSTRVASVRTADVLLIRRAGDDADPAPSAPPSTATPGGQVAGNR